MRKAGSQKYHLECSTIVQKAKATESARIRKNFKLEQKRKSEKKKKQLSIADVSKMAEKAGCSYGEMSLRLAKGEER